MQALPHLDLAAPVLVLYGDVPLIDAATLEPLVQSARSGRLALLTARLPDPTGYGRIVRVGASVQRIVEHRDAGPTELAIDEVNTGIMAIPGPRLAGWLERLRAAGLSARKAEYILDLSTHFSKKLVQPTKWEHMPDEEIIEELTAIRGIGRWTAEMFLIFNLQRPDVLPLDDVGLLNAISLHYFSGEPVSRFEAREVAQGWQPFRTVATWYLWRSLDPVPVEY
jgi:hypothetical protein